MAGGELFRLEASEFINQRTGIKIKAIKKGDCSYGD